MSLLEGEGRREEGAPGPARAGAVPGAQSQERESASCWFMLRVPSISGIKNLSL